MHGLMGKILSVDLNESVISEIETLTYSEKYLGGRGIGSRIYWETVIPDVKAFDPENRLIFMAGTLVATGVQGASRMSIVGKSPMTYPEGFCYGNLGGHFPAYLKRAGYDGIVLSGRSERPVYLWIKDNEVQILSASSLWGKNTHEVGKILKDIHGKKVQYLTTGVAGERMVRMAVIAARGESYSTGGFGAVMGSKNLKAIAVIGTGKPSVENPDKLKELNHYTIKIGERIPYENIIKSGHGPGAGLKMREKAKCYQCGMDCMKKQYIFPNGKKAIRKCQAMAYYMPMMFGKKDEPIDTFADATGMANDHSLCTKELSKIIRWLHECQKTGALSEEETGLPLSQIGTRYFLEKLLDSISFRKKGFGDILAQGLIRAREEVSEEAKSLTPENLIGVDFADAYSPKVFVTHALLNPMEPRGHIPMFHHLAFFWREWSIHNTRPDISPVSTEVFLKVAKKFWGSEEAGNVTSYNGKALAAKITQNRMCIYDSLGLCDFVWPILYSFNTLDNVGDPDLESQIFSAVTGMGRKDLETAGERIFNLQRLILLREGREVPEADYPGEHIFKETPTTNMRGIPEEMEVPGSGGSIITLKSSSIDKEKYTETLKEYYRLRGWDEETGHPLSDTLTALDQDDLVQGFNRPS